MVRRLALLLLLGWATMAWAKAQLPAADSLRLLLRTQLRADTTRVRRLQALAGEVLVQDAPRSIALFRQSLALARQLRDSVGQGRALLRLGTLYRRQADYGQAQHYNQQAQRLFRRQHNRAGLAQTYLQTALIEMVQGNPTPALNAALQALHLAEQAGNPTIQTQIRVTIGSIYVQLGDYQNALPMLRAVLKNGVRMGNQQVVVSALSLLGSAYQAQKKWAQAQAYYLRSARLNRQLGDTQSEAGDETNLADLYEEQGNHAMALAHGRRARALALAHHHDYSLPAAELALARIYLATQQPDSTIALAEHGLQLSQKRRSNENIRNASELLARAYAARGDYARAYHYHTLFVDYKDTLSGEETLRKTSALRYGYELNKKQSQIALLTKTRQLQIQKSARQRLQLYGLLAGMGSFVLLAALLWRNVRLKQRTNRQLNERNTQIAAQRDDLNHTLRELRTTQAQLVQHEKMASLGELTAGIAHEIQNPLNFVNNFADVSEELVVELQEKHPAADAAETELWDDLTQNLQRISLHGQRAARIVRSMLQHSRASTGERQPTNLNALCDEYLHLAYHGPRAKDKNFNVELKTDFSPNLPELNVVAADLGRVLLNLFTNAFYALQERQKWGTAGYQATVCVRTRCTATEVHIQVRDNGTGMSEAVGQKVFQPFFTTKPVGEGTGLGLSLSYDIITQGHGGTLTVESEEGQGSTFEITLPTSSQK